MCRPAIWLRPSGGKLTRARHLAIPTYGSYYRAGVPAGEQKSPPFQAVLATAAELGAGGIRSGRIWSRRKKRRRSMGENDRRPGQDPRPGRRKRPAGLPGIHNNTLNDRDASTRRLLEAVDGIYTFWQPLNELTREENIKTLTTARNRWPICMSSRTRAPAACWKPANRTGKPISACCRNRTACRPGPTSRAV